ncbi:ATP-binding cassette domain-containing protein [Polymorphospora lycopeni]|uniref:ATP-binding cassette domain-containing protein n=1 Tax=Polymorphospora lycopeni TaxID=3140240 RepID=A0ABV5CXL1_9ACTN
MNQDAWLAALVGELRRHGVGPDLAGHVVAEAATHLRDSGEPPLSAFGAPGSYARDVADSIGAAAPAPRRPPPGPVRLDVRGISKRYRRHRVLSDVNLTVRAGQIAAVVGANGAGKSTFLRICAGLVSPDRGEVHAYGSLGYCPQDGGTREFLTPDEHFVLIGTGRDLDRSAARRAGRAHAARLDWEPDRGRLAGQLSGGTRQKLNLVMARLGEPDILLLDEPYQGFDRGAYLDFWHEVWRWRDTGTAVVVVTHLLNQLDRVDIVLDLTPDRERVV